MLSAAIDIHEPDWIATTAYYACYFSFYAILQRCGINSENHKCTITLMYLLFVKKKLIHKSMYKQLLKFKEIRVRTQHYTEFTINEPSLIKDCKKAFEFTRHMKDILHNLTTSNIENVRSLLKKGKYNQKHGKDGCTL